MTVLQDNIGRQKSLAGVAKAVFDVKGDPELQQRAEEALQRANPGLVDIGTLRPGTPILVPDIGLGDRRKTQERPAEAMARAGRAVAVLADQAGAPLDAAVKTVAEGAKALKLKATTDAIVEMRPDLKNKLPEIAAAAEQEATRAAEAVTELRAVIARIGSVLPEVRG